MRRVARTAALVAVTGADGTAAASLDVTLGSQDLAQRATTRKACVANELRTSLVPFNRAKPETQAAYLEGLKILRDLDGHPKEWRCSCGETTAGTDILISYDVGDTPIPHCSSCWAYEGLTPVTV
jgi:hypothetical protein